MRQYLKRTSFYGLTNAQLDRSRLMLLEQFPLFEDEEGRPFALLSCKGMSDEDRAFRKVRAMIPFEYKGKLAKSFKWKNYTGHDCREQKDAVNKFITRFDDFREKGIGLYIYSKTKGSGKTMLSCCILNEIANRYPVSVKFITILDLLEVTKQSYNGADDTLRSLYGATVLVIDDIGVQMRKDWVDTVLFKLINARYTERMITVYTSNVSMEDLNLDDRIKDRIQSNCIEVHMPEIPVRNILKSAEKRQFMDSLENAPDGATNTEQGE